MVRALLALFVLLLGGCASVEEARTLGRYDFSYRIEGDTRAAPLQIFDDGRQTYLQFRDAVPGIFAMDGEGKSVALATRNDGQFVIADRIEREFIFILDLEQRRASARYVGKQNRSVLPHELPPPSGPEVSQQAQPVTKKVLFRKGSNPLTDEALLLLDRRVPATDAAQPLAILEQPTRRVHGGIPARATVASSALPVWEVDVDRILFLNGAAVAPKCCEIILTPPAGETKSLEHASASSTDPSVPPLHGAAAPIQASRPAQPVFVDREGRVGRGSSEP